MIKTDTIKEIAEGILAFLKNNNLEDGLPQLINYLKEKGDENVANIYSPKKLDASEKKMAEKMFTNLAGESPKKINFYEDKTLIDGLKISFKDKLWDFSLRAQIGGLKKV